MSLKVAILYGFGEGAWHGHGLRKSLLAAGFELAAKAEDADVIIAHSGGMYGLPADTTGKVIFIIAPCCGQPDKSWLQTQSAKVLQDMKYFISNGSFLRWVQKSFWNAVHLIMQAPRLAQLWRIHQEHKGGLPITGTTTIVMTFADDPWSGYISTEEFTKHPTYKVIESNAIHDDIWLHPDIYVELLQKELAPLLLLKDGL